MLRRQLPAPLLARPAPRHPALPRLAPPLTWSIPTKPQSLLEASSTEQLALATTALTALWVAARPSAVATRIVRMVPVLCSDSDLRERESESREGARCVHCDELWARPGVRARARWTDDTDTHRAVRVMMFTSAAGL